MASKVVETKIIKLAIDDKELAKGLKNAISSMGELKTKFTEVTKNMDFDKATRGVSSLTYKFSSLIQRIPGVNNVGNSIRKLGERALDSEGALMKTASTMQSGFKSSLPVIGGVVDAILGIGKSAGKTVIQVSEINGVKFNGIDNAAVGTQAALHGIGDAVYGVTERFSMLQQIGMYALGNLAAKAMQVGSKMIYDNTLGPIVGGYNEFAMEQETLRVLEYANQIQGKGDIYDRDAINKIMRRVEQYALETKYSASAMNNSLGIMVNAGIDLEDAATAMIGFSNLAAAAGTSAEAAERALTFGLRQSMSVGYMQLADWKSLESANVTSVEFQRKLVEAAYRQGVDMSEFEKAGGANAFDENGNVVDITALTGAVRESMTRGKWMTNAVMIEVLNEMANDEALQKLAQNLYSYKDAAEAISEGVSNAWSNIWRELTGSGMDTAKIWTGFGNTVERVKTLFPKFIGSFTEMFDSEEIKGSKSVLKFFDNLWGGDWSAKFDENGDFVTADNITGLIPRMFYRIGEAYNKVFTKDMRFDLMARLADWIDRIADKTTISEGALNKLEKAFRGIFTAMKHGFQVLDFFRKMISALIPDNTLSLLWDTLKIFGNLAKVVWDVGVAILDMIFPFKKSGEFAETTGSTINKVFERIHKVVNWVNEKIVAFGESLVGGINKAKDFARGIGDSIPKLNIFQRLIALITRTFNGLSGGFKATVKLFELLFSPLKEGETRLGRLSKHLNAFSYALGPIGRPLKHFVNGLLGMNEESGKAIGIAGDLGRAIRSLFVDFKDGWRNFDDGTYEPANALQWLGYNIGFVVNQIQDFFTPAVEGAKYVIENWDMLLTNAIKTVGQFAGLLGMGVLGGVVVITMEAFNLLGGAIGTVIELINKTFNLNIQNPFQPWTVHANEVKASMGDTNAELQDLYARMQNPPTSFNEWLKNSTESIITHKNALGLFKGAYQGIGHSIKMGVGGLNKAINFSGLMDGLRGLSVGMDVESTKMYKVGRYIRENFKFDVDHIIDAAKALPGRLLNAIKGMPQNLAGIARAIGGVFRDIPGSIKKAMDSLKGGNLKFDLYGMFKKGIDSLTTAIPKAMQGIADVVSKLLEPIFAATGKFGDIMRDVFNSIKEGTNMINLGNIASLLLLFNTVKAIKGGGILSKIFGKVTDLKEFFKIGDFMEEASKGVKRFTKAVAFEKTTDGIKNLAKGVLMLAGAMLVVSTIPSDKIVAAGVAVAGLTTVALGLFAAFEYIKSKFPDEKKEINTDKGFGKLIAVISEILDGSGLKQLNQKLGNAALIAAAAYAVVQVVKALEVINSLPLMSILKGLGVVGMILAELVLAVGIMSRFDVGIGHGVTVAALAYAIKMIVSIISDVAAIDDGLLKKSELAIAGLALAISLAIGLMSGEVGGIKWGQVNLNHVTTVAALSQAIKSMTKSMISLAESGMSKSSMDQVLKVVDNLMSSISGSIALMTGEVSVKGGGKAGGKNGASGHFGVSGKWGDVAASHAATVLALGRAVKSMTKSMIDIADSGMNATTSYRVRDIVTQLMSSISHAVNTMSGETDYGGEVAGGGGWLKASGKGHYTKKVGQISGSHVAAVAALAAAVKSMIGDMKTLANSGMDESTMEGVRSNVVNLAKGLAEAVALMGTDLSGGLDVEAKGVTVGVNGALKKGLASESHAAIVAAMTLGIKSMVGDMKTLAKSGMDAATMAKVQETVVNLAKGLAEAIQIMGKDVGLNGSLNSENKDGDKVTASVGASLKDGITSDSQAAVVGALVLGIKSMINDMQTLAKIDPASMDKAKDTIIALTKTLAKAVSLLGGSAAGKLSGGDKSAEANIDWGAVNAGQVETISALVLGVKTLAADTIELSKHPADQIKMAGETIQGLMYSLGFAVMMARLDFSLTGQGKLAPGEINTEGLTSMYGVVKSVETLMGIAMEIAHTSDVGAVRLAADAIQELITAIGISTGIITLAATFSTFNPGGMAMVAFAIGATVLVAQELVKLTEVSGEQLDSASDAIGKVLLALAVLTGVNNLTGNIASAIPALLGMAGAMGAVYVIGEAMRKIGELPADQIYAAGQMLSLTLVALAGAGVIANFGVPGLMALAGAALAIGAAAVPFGIGAKLMAEAFKLLVEGLQELYNLISTVIDDIMGAFGRLTDWVSGGGIGEVFSTVGGWFGGVLDGALEWGANVGDNIAKGLDSMSPTVHASSIEMTNNVNKGLESGLPTSTSIGQNTGKNYSTGVSSQVSSANTSGSTVGKNAVSGMTSGSSGANATGSKAGSQYAAGMRGKAGDAKNAGSNVASNAGSGLKSQDGTMHSSGASTVQQWINGLWSKVGAVKQAASDIVGAFRSFFGNSPAKQGVFSGSGWPKFKQSGADTVQQWIDGTASMIPEVKNVANEITQIFNRALGENNSPTITPVIDTTGIEVPDISDRLRASGIKMVGGAVKFDIDPMNPKFEQMARDLQQSGKMETLLKQLRGYFTDLIDETRTQTKEVAKGHIIYANIDSRNVNKTLAPGMQRAIAANQARAARLGGVVPE